MNTPYKKITYSDVWFSYFPKKVSEADLWMGRRVNAAGNLVTSNDFFDLFATLIKRIGYAPLKRYATRMGVPVAYLNPAIVAMTGLSPKVWIEEFTARGACELLADTNMPLGKIAEQLGFACHETFDRFFRRRFKMTPGDWRIAFPASPPAPLQKRGEAFAHTYV
jgi:AraC-like DNA-binding protein